MAAWKYEISLLVLSSRVSSLRISVRRQYLTELIGSKTLPRIQNTSQNPKNFPESKNTSQNPNTLPRIQNTSQNPKHFPGDARAYHEWPRVIAGTVICKLVTRSLVVDGRRVEASRILECEDLSFPKKHTFVDVRCDQILWERASFSLWRIF